MLKLLIDQRNNYEDIDEVFSPGVSLHVHFLHPVQYNVQSEKAIMFSVTKMINERSIGWLTI